MSAYIPTIEALKGKTERELDAIFKKAAEHAASTACEPSEKQAAKQTMENVRRCLIRLDGP